MDLIRVDRGRLKRSFDEISSFGATAAGGMHRLALSDPDRDARRWLVEVCEESGYHVCVDRIGSIFATRIGSDPAQPPLMIGSHLDSQPLGGRFDGAVGVIAALEVLQTLDDHEIETETTVQLVNWTNEEGARFRPPLLGSGVFAGIYDVDFALGCRDDHGTSLGDELERIGFTGRVEPGWPLSGYIEIHIEQGSVLERARRPIGIVNGVVGIRDLVIKVRGDDSHAGPLEMHLRRDALVGAAEMILKANEIGLRHAPEARTTVGRITVPSNSHSVVPGRADFVLDIRHSEVEALDAIESELRDAFQNIAAARGLDIGFEALFAFPPIHFDAALQKSIGTAAERYGYATLSLPSRAGHDAWNIARIAPAAMIFIPCRDGISHNEAEFAAFGDIAASADVLLGTIIDRCGGR